MAQTSRPYKVIVVGAGVVGLSSAVSIQQTCPEAEMTIVADKFSPDTTSDVSGGFWEPFALGETDSELIRHTCKLTHEHIAKLATSSLAKETGTQLLSGYMLFEGKEHQYDFVPSIVYGLRPLSKDELDNYQGVKSGYFYTTVKVDVTQYLNWLLKRFKAQGGIVKHAKVNSCTELYPDYDVVVNCCGLGARDLLNDTELSPSRGQVIRVRAPWIKHFSVFQPEDGMHFSYILPGSDYAVVGGCAHVGQWSTEVDEHEVRSIWERAMCLWPQLKGGEVLGTWVGLRPTRSSLRLEGEMVHYEGRNIKVIHNYGHGGAGVTLHWGCALLTAKLVNAYLFPDTLRVKARM